MIWILIGIGVFMFFGIRGLINDVKQHKARMERIRKAHEENMKTFARIFED